MIKFVLVGPVGTGKSALLAKFAGEDHDGMPTIGIDFRNEIVSIDGQRIKLQIVRLCFGVLGTLATLIRAASTSQISYFIFSDRAICTPCCKQPQWDKTGQEKYRAVLTAYFRGAKAVLFVYDITKQVCDRP